MQFRKVNEPKGTLQTPRKENYILGTECALLKLKRFLMSIAKVICFENCDANQASQLVRPYVEP